MAEFILGRGSYWIIIALMMTGLYITFSAQNFIKRLIGLSVFQTSVFLFYITLGKVAGGTAPILFGEDLPKYGSYDSHGGDGYGEDAEGGYGASDSVGGYGEPSAVETDSGTIDAGPDAIDAVSSDVELDVVEAIPSDGVVDGAASDAAPDLASEIEAPVESDRVDLAPVEVDPSTGDIAQTVVESTLYNAYSNPLPHVLILTAIVVGVATLSVGLAIIVRIRESYGTIEADEVRIIDMEVALAEELEDQPIGDAA